MGGERRRKAVGSLSLENRGEESSYALEESGMLGFLLRRRGWLNDRIEVNLALRGLVGRQVRWGLRRNRDRGRSRFRTILCTEDKRSIDLHVNVVWLRCREGGRLRTIRQLRTALMGICSAVRYWIAGHPRSKGGRWRI